MSKAAAQLKLDDYERQVLITKTTAERMTRGVMKDVLMTTSLMAVDQIAVMQAIVDAIPEE